MSHKASSKGLIIVYTGDGKGKTTASMGLALRAAGYDKPVCVIQFAKIWFTGEKKGFEGLPTVEFWQLGEGFFQILGDQKDPEVHKRAAGEALRVAREKTMSGKYDVLVLDEIIGCEVGGLLERGSIMKLLLEKPDNLDIVLTGRHAETIEGLLEIADLVTEMKKIKHPYDQGILAKKSIDF